MTVSREQHEGPHVPPMIEASSASNESVDVYQVARGHEIIYHTPQRNKKKRTLFRSKRAESEQGYRPGGTGGDVVVAACKIITQTPINLQLEAPYLKEISIGIAMNLNLQTGKGFRDWSIILVVAALFMSKWESIDFDCLSIMVLFALLIAFLMLMKINDVVNRYLEEKKLV